MSKLRARPVVGAGIVLGVALWASAAAPVTSDAPRLRAAGRGRPWINLRDATPQTFSLRNASGAPDNPVLDQASPSAATVGDFDRDGVPDVLAAFATRKGGVLALYFGDPAALASESSSPPFRGEAYVRRLAVRPDFVAAGDFDADGDVDAVVATRGVAQLVFLAGGVGGVLGPARTIGLPGGVTSIAAGDINRPDGLSDLAVAVESATSASLLVFESPRGALSGDSPETVPLLSPASDLAPGRFHDRVARDVAVATRTGLVVIEGRDRKLSLTSDARSRVPAARLAVLDIPGGAAAVAAGEFSPPDQADGDDREELAVLDSGGHLFLAALEDGKAGSGQFATRPIPVETADSTGAATFPTGTRLTRGRVSSLRGDDLLLVDGPGRRIVALHPARDAESTTVQDSKASNPVASIVLDAEGTVVTAIPMRLNADGQDDLVVFDRESPTPAVALSAPLSTFTVNSLTESSLRAAINSANASPGADLIVFNVGSGTPTFFPHDPLPTISDPVTLLGDTGGATRIQIGGSLIFPTHIGPLLQLDAGAQGSVVRGFVLNRNQHNCMIVSSSDTRIEGSWIGLDAAGGFSVYGCNSDVLGVGGARNIIGGATVAARNVIANSDGSVSFLLGGTGTVVQGNYISTNATGTLLSPSSSDYVFVYGSPGMLIGGPTSTPGEPPGNLFGKYVSMMRESEGVVMQGNMLGLKADGITPIGNGGVGLDYDTQDITIGGPSASLRNVISGASGVAIFNIDHSGPSNNLVQGNWIGLTRDGSANAGISFGISLTDSGATIGGVAAVPGEPPGNVISGSTGDGIRISGFSDLAILGNRIGGEGAAGPQAGNAGHGISFLSSSVDIVVGGASTESGACSGACNRIAFNGLSGISAAGNGVLRSVFRGNSIVGNGALGIDLGPVGVTPNDAGDSDTGPNELQNYPVIERAEFDGAETTVEGTLNGHPDSTFEVELFSNPSGRDPSGHGQGELPVGEATTATDGSGFARFVLTVPGELVFPTAVARDSAGNTSEFSSAFADPGEASPQELHTSRGVGSSVTLDYVPACGSTDHAVYAGVAGPEGIAGQLSWSASFCGLGDSGTTAFDPGDPAPGSLIYFVIVGQSDSLEGSYGLDSAGAQRAEAVGVGDCDLPRALGETCQ